MRVVFSVIFVLAMDLWTTGAIVTYIYDTGVRKTECVQKEGWFKGILWCESSPKNQYALAATHFSSVMDAAIWPVRIYTYTKCESDDQLSC